MANHHKHTISDHNEEEIPEDDVVQQDEDNMFNPDELPTDLVRVKSIHSSETMLCKRPDEFEVEKGDLVIVGARYGRDLGKVLGGVSSPGKVMRDSMNQIFRKATERDLEKWEVDSKKEKEAFNLCLEKIRKHGLTMKLVSAHYLLDEAKILFFFTAENRVDFRELVKDLVGIFKIRIELRQIGVRDESRVLGGAGVCGRIFCCNGLTDNLRPVSIKMAKDQNLSLNSMKISGPCGRLLCCLCYEHDTYVDERKKVPSEGTKVRGSKAMYRVSDVNILSRKIRLTSSEGTIMQVPFDRFSYNSERSQWNCVTADIEEN